MANEHIQSAQDAELIKGIAAGDVDPLQIDEHRLQALCELLNKAYRAGQPIVDDAIYDRLFVDPLRVINPDNSFLASVEPEGDVFDAPTVRHERPMLSTEKAYSAEEVERFVARLQATAAELGISASELRLRVTPKLDGIACRDNGRVLATRGDGLSGSDITHILERGAVIAGAERGLGDGEIVVVQSYFLDVLKPQFDIAHPRNYITGFCGADSVKEHHRDAAAAQAVVFVPYRTLQAWEGTAEEFKADWAAICEEVKRGVPYLTDGAIVEAVDPDIKNELGATSSHHRWMLAVKEKGETALTTAISITWQTGRTGRVTPVVELDPIYLSGAKISRVTAHHAGNVRNLGIGPGARLEIIRSGEVIPKIERVAEPVTAVIPSLCPCCEHELLLEGDFLVCPNNLGCSAQASTTLIHFFKTLGNVDLFGPKTVETLVANGVTDLRAIYALGEPQLQSMGFGPGQATNLVRELERSQRQEVEDWRYLAAFGLPHLGRGDSRKLLEGLTLESLIEGVNPEQIQHLDGFGELTSRSISASMSERAELIGGLMPSFNLRRTGAAAPKRADVAESPITGKHVVFTGTLASGSREALQEQARGLGATVQSSVNSKTDYLVCGAKVGASKTAKAQSLGVQVISEEAYLGLISAMAMPA